MSDLKLSVQKQNIQTNYLSTGELKKVENIWMRSVQGKFAKNRNIKQLQIKLGSYLDQKNIWRYKGR